MNSSTSVIDPTSTPSEFVWLNPPSISSVQSALGPIALANWVIPSRLCVGGYPSALSSDKAHQYAEALVACRFNCIVNLMQTHELNRFREYAGAMEYLAQHASPPFSIDFLHFPIPDGGLPADPEQFLVLINELLTRLRDNADTRIYIHVGKHLYST
jgi:hypothetical protein